MSKTNWQTKKFGDCLEKITYTNKIQRKDFLKSGNFPIVSQEKDLINGYWNKKKDLFKISIPLVIFGDHTQILKYIDFDFVLGADGVKILQPKNFLDSKYFYYFLLNIDLKNLGYARHYRLLKEKNILFPESLSEQYRIVKILDKVFEEIAKAKENTEKNLQNAKDLFESYSKKIFDQIKVNRKEKTIGEVCNLMTGGTPSKSKREYFKDGKILWLVSGDIHQKEIYKCEGRITDEGMKDSNAKYLPVNSILIALNGQGKTRGTVAMLKVKATCNQSLVSIYPKDIEEILPEYIFRNLNSRYNEIRKITGDVGNERRGLNMILIRKIIIPITSISNQKSIVKKLDELAEKTKRLEEIYRQKLADLEELKKSILKKAFEGNL